MGIKKFLRVSTALGFNACALYLMPDFFFSEFMKKNKQLVINDQDVLVPSQIESLLSNVIEDIKSKDVEMKLIKPFMTKELDVVEVGFAGGYSGCCLGIPQNFLLENKAKEIGTSKVNGYELPSSISSPTDTPDTSVIFSEDAKKFAIAQKLFISHELGFIFIGLLPILFIAIGYIALKKVTRTFRNHLRKDYLFSFYSFQIVAFGGVCWLLIKDYYHSYREILSDLNASNLGESYHKGGIEYYKKLLERNKLIKENDPKAPYTESGDVKNRIGIEPKVSLNLKLKFLKDLLNAIEKKEEKPSILSYINVIDILKDT